VPHSLLAASAVHELPHEAHSRLALRHGVCHHTQDLEH
jgi:hypothetical protein